MNKGFTIIETLVAIAIMMIAIAGPLTIASQALNAAVNAKNIMVASNLAEEGMEYLKNIKDNNIATAASDWLYGITDDGRALCAGSSNDCTIPAIENDQPFQTAITSCGGTDGCMLYLNPATGYQYSDSGGTLTPFRRSFYITPVPGTTEEMIVTVNVSWTQGTVSNEVQLSELMTSTPR